MSEKSHGTKLNTTVSSTLTVVSKAKDFDFNRGEWGETDITNHDSQGDEEIMPDGVNGGKALSFSYEVLESDPGQGQLEADFLSGDINDYTLVTPGSDSKTYTFSAYVMSLSQPLPVRGSQVKTCNLRVTGPMVKTDTP